MDGQTTWAAAAADLVTEKEQAQTKQAQAAPKSPIAL